MESAIVLDNLQAGDITYTFTLEGTKGGRIHLTTTDSTTELFIRLKSMLESPKNYTELIPIMGELYKPTRIEMLSTGTFNESYQTIKGEKKSDVVQ